MKFIIFSIDYDVDCYMYKDKLKDFNVEKVVTDNGVISFYITINTIEELHRLAKALDQQLIFDANDYFGCDGSIKIYDGWNE